MLVYHALTVLPFVALAHGGPLAGRNPHTCDTGEIHCCQSVQEPGSPAASTLASLLNLTLGNGPVGLFCTSLAGAGSAAKCASTPVCCNNTDYHGLINVGCSPINIL